MSPLHAALLIATGMATAYTALPGAPLYCDRGNGLTFHAVTEPWVALDVSEYTTGRVHCGDEILVLFGDGTRFRARALDAGPLYPYIVADTGLPIVVDIPAHHAPFPGLSAPAAVINVTTMRAQIRELIHAILPRPTEGLHP